MYTFTMRGRACISVQAACKGDAWAALGQFLRATGTYAWQWNLVV